MRKVLFIFTLLFALTANAQKIQEAEFSGNVRAFMPDSTIVQLDKTNVQVKTKATGSKIWWGIGSSKAFIEVPGNEAKAKFKTDSGFQLVVKVSDNNIDPSSVVMLFKMEVKGKNRRGQMGKVNNFMGNSVQGFEQINYEGKKFGKSSYIIDPGTLPVGNYGVVVLNPDKPNDTNLIVYSFDVI
jgi:hypothetical protein